jgi:restriction endonuclease Mrr
MADPKPYVVARWISSEMRDVAFIPLQDAVAAVVARRLTEKSPEELAELSEGLAPAVFDELLIVSVQNADRGVEATFELAGERGDAHIRAAQTEAPLVLEKLLGLSPKAFEDFCASVLSAIGGKGQSVGRVGDGGVDFLAMAVPFGSSSGAAFRAACPLVVGQAKRYKEDNLVSEAEVRDFLGGALVRAVQVQRDNNYGLMSPVVFAFWTTSELNAKAMEYAKRAGVWYLGGLALAQLAARLQIPLDHET